MTTEPFTWDDLIWGANQGMKEDSIYAEKYRYDVCYIIFTGNVANP